ncbi:uncharacterized protein CDAR_38461 [Caerostris darwini]|uniref:Uncharacterized protein n=1 Tax=Caerostris darwini TaxID=1538125 RepID=A0AAV4T426_9ARAC|nr:uncharacterized protein CDAR_38461 [Caerostris darwini]
MTVFMCNQTLFIVGLKFDVLSCQAYKLTKARYTLSNEAVSDFHRKTVAQSVTEQLLDLYNADTEKKLKKQDSKELKQFPPRTASFIPVTSELVKEKKKKDLFTFCSRLFFSW